MIQVEKLIKYFAPSYWVKRLLFIGAIFAIVLGAPHVAAAQEFSNNAASLPELVRSPDPKLLPQPLNSFNAEIYRQIFALQAKGSFGAADRLIDQLTDITLLPHVLANRYLSPKYKATAAELSSWLKNNADLADAPELYTLARAKGAKIAKPRGTLIDRTLSPDESANDKDPDWLAGLSEWKNKNYARAAEYFTKAAGKNHLPSWDKAAAAYWAGRSYGAAHQPQKVTPWFRQAAQLPRTFYGQLARRALGMTGGLDWRVPAASLDDVHLLANHKAGRAALALIQIGQVTLAEQQLLALAQEEGAQWDNALLSIAHAAGLPSLVLKIGYEQGSKTQLDAVLFPVPAWRPGPGYTINRALLFAIMRQESGFNPRAKSPAGARGLMQLMPATARHVSGKNNANLADPVTSISIGQSYIQELLNDPAIHNDLILLAAAYNAGPGNLKKWYSASRTKEDALLFMETIPSRETRSFVERVLANYWIYRDRLGQQTPSMDELVSGGWVPYKADALQPDRNIASSAAIQ